MIKYILCIAYILFSVSGLTLIKMGSSQTENSILIPIIEVFVSKWSFIGIICYGMSFCLYLGVVSKFDLGLIIPFVGGIINILILCTSYFVLKEKLSANMVVGAVIVTIGIVIMNFKKG